MNDPKNDPKLPSALLLQPKFQLEQTVPILTMNGISEGIIKGIRINGTYEVPDEDVHPSSYAWTYTIEYQIYFLAVDRIERDKWNRLHPDEPMSDEHFLIWIKWGWVSEADILKVQGEEHET